jgi:hypothetical protein
MNRPELFSILGGAVLVEAVLMGVLVNPSSAVPRRASDRASSSIPAIL